MLVHASKWPVSNWVVMLPTSAAHGLVFPGAAVLYSGWKLNGFPEQLAIEADSVSRMNELLEILPAKQREILILRVVVGLSAEETALTEVGTAVNDARYDGPECLAPPTASLQASLF